MVSSKSASSSDASLASEQQVSEQRDEEKEVAGESLVRHEGRIPELTIKLSGRQTMPEAAWRLGYQLVAVTRSEVLGKIENETLSPMSTGDLQRYATRARSAEDYPRYAEIKRQIERQFGDDGVDLVYLVPEHVEQRFVSMQMKALQKVGLQAEDTATMTARYVEGASSIEVLTATTRSGKQVQL